MSRSARVEVFQDHAGAWRWRLVAGNGQVAGSSGEGFASRWGARRAAARAQVLLGAAAAPRRALRGAQAVARAVVGAPSTAGFGLGPFGHGSFGLAPATAPATTRLPLGALPWSSARGSTVVLDASGRQVGRMGSAALATQTVQWVNATPRATFGGLGLAEDTATR